jgi:hypothetical protein
LDEEVRDEELREKVRRKRTLGPEDERMVEEDIGARERKRIRLRRIAEEEGVPLPPEQPIVTGGPITEEVQDRLDQMSDYLQDLYTNKSAAQQELKSFIELNADNLYDPSVQQEGRGLEEMVDQIEAEIEDKIREIQELITSIPKPPPTQVSRPSAEEVVTLFRRATNEMLNYPNGIHYKDLAAILWQKQGGSEEEIQQPSPEFLAFAKRVNTALNKTRIDNPVLKLSGWKTSKGSGMGVYILREFISPNNINNILDTAEKIARNRNFKNFNRQYLNDLLKREIQRKIRQGYEFEDEEEEVPSPLRQPIQGGIGTILTGLASALNTQVPPSIHPPFNNDTIQYIENIVEDVGFPVQSIPEVLNLTVQPYIQVYTRASLMPSRPSYTDVLDAVTRAVIQSIQTGKKGVVDPDLIAGQFV